MGGQQQKLKASIVNQRAVTISSSAVNINTEILLVLISFIVVILFLKYTKKYINTHINKANIKN